MTKPMLHVTPARHWMNDPNGFIYFHGRYHLFYQHFPYENAWGTMHWGHKVSDNLVDWEDLGIALYPSKPYDRNGVFSGSAQVINDELYLYYTGIVYDRYRGEDIHRQEGDGFHACQVLTTSKDGYHFDAQNKRVVVDSFAENTPYGHRVHTRDPKVIQAGDKYYMLLGSKYQKPGQEKTTGMILIYESEGGVHFTFQSKLEDDAIGDMWECPDYFELSGQGILTLSPENIYPENSGHYQNQAVYIPALFKNGKMEITGPARLLDIGEDLYAAQSNLDEDGRRVQFGWMRMPDPEKDGQWIGMMTCPRVLSFHDGQLYTLPHPHYAGAFTIPCGDFHPEKARKMVVDLNPGGAVNIGGYELSYHEDGTIHADREAVFPDNSHIATHFQTTPQPGCHLEIYSDAHIIETFINDGREVLSNIVYNLKNDLSFSNIRYFAIYKTDRE